MFNTLLSILSSITRKVYIFDIHTIYPPLVFFLLFQLVSELGLKGRISNNIKEKILYNKEMEEGFSTTNKPPMFRGIKYYY